MCKTYFLLKKSEIVGKQKEKLPSFQLEVLSAAILPSFAQNSAAWPPSSHQSGFAPPQSNRVPHWHVFGHLHSSGHLGKIHTSLKQTWPTLKLEHIKNTAADPGEFHKFKHLTFNNISSVSVLLGVVKDVKAEHGQQCGNCGGGWAWVEGEEV